MGGQKTMRGVRTTLGEMLQDDRVMTVIWKTPS